MIICSRCKTENKDDVKFCIECGNDLITNVDAPANVDLKNLADSLNEQAVHTAKQPFNLNNAISDIPKKIGNKLKKIGKKKIITFFGLLIVIIVCIALTVGYIIPYAPHYFKGNAAFKELDYQTAIKEYKLAGSFLNTKSKLDDAHYLFAEKLYKENNFYDAAVNYDLVKTYEDTESKIILCGTKLLENKEYKNSIDVFEMTDADEAEALKNYASGMNSVNDGNYETAKKKFC